MHWLAAARAYGTGRQWVGSSGVRSSLEVMAGRRVGQTEGVMLGLPRFLGQ